jgi:hypothetical protein
MVRRNKKNIVTLGHTLRVKIVLKYRDNDGRLEYWFDVPRFFDSRALAQDYAKEHHPGRKIHISRNRYDATPLENESVRDPMAEMTVSKPVADGPAA